MKTHHGLQLTRRQVISGSDRPDGTHVSHSESRQWSGVGRLQGGGDYRLTDPRWGHSISEDVDRVVGRKGEQGFHIDQECAYKRRPSNLYHFADLLHHGPAYHSALSILCEKDRYHSASPPWSPLLVIKSWSQTAAGLCSGEGRAAVMQTSPGSQTRPGAKGGMVVVEVWEGSKSVDHAHFPQSVRGRQQADIKGLRWGAGQREPGKVYLKLPYYCKLEF